MLSVLQSSVSVPSVTLDVEWPSHVTVSPTMVLSLGFGVKTLTFLPERLSALESSRYC